MDAEVEAVARRLAELGSDTATRVFKMSWWSERLIAWAMSDDSFKTQLFRLVDVYPAIIDKDDLARHLAEYFHGVKVPMALDVGMAAAEHVPGGHRIEAVVARRNIERMARQFIAGDGPAGAAETLGRLWRDGSACTVDLLGEKTVTSTQADRYAARVAELLDVLAAATAEWPPDPHLEADDIGPLPRVNLSVKPTALATHFEPLSADHGVASAFGRLEPILCRAAEVGAHVHLDMEHYEVKDLSLRLLERICEDRRFDHLSLGAVVQAYLRDAETDVGDLISMSTARSTPLTVRLVKGAYWDTETVLARQAGWPSPVWTVKADTDANYERLTRLLHSHHGKVRAAFGSHNLRSLAHAVVCARHLGIDDSAYEIQMLHGMAEPVHLAVRRLGLRLRVYAPVGELVPGMAYLVRRLLENTSNESFVRHQWSEGDELSALLAPPTPVELDVGGRLEPVFGDGRGPTDVASLSPMRREPPARWFRSVVRDAQARAIDALAERLGADVPLVIAGERVSTSRTFASTDPADPSVVVAMMSMADGSDVDAAVSAAADAGPSWAATSPTERAGVLFGAAAWMRERRPDIAALEVVEAGKPWAEADGDVCEAIDFCEYYGREALRLAGGGVIESLPGEANELRYDPLGVTAVVAPWNFPLAIPTGMTTAALVAGNPVVLKPAEQTPAVAAVLVDALYAAGLPPGVLSFLPGVGEEVGPRLVAHPDVAMVAFTGSLAVGQQILEATSVVQPGQRHLKRAVVELGGKNAVVVDHDADLEQVVPALVASAFGYAGQKCSAASRVIVVRSRHDELLARLAEATTELIVGPPRDPSTFVGPVIDADAVARIDAAVAAARAGGATIHEHAGYGGPGHWVSPAVVSDVDVSDPVACDELFGPVVAVMAADDFDSALAMADASPYALTAGVFTRSPAHAEAARRALRAGNLYINRSTTGAIVGRQPFGGHGLSGLGTKAGGPDYLQRFMAARVVTENTMRQGFAPPSDN